MNTYLLLASDTGDNVPLIAAISALSGILITHALSGYKANREYRLKKLEEMYDYVAKYCHLRTGELIDYGCLMRGDMTRASLVTYLGTLPDKDVNTLGEIEMILNIYWLQLKPQFRILPALFMRVDMFISDYMRIHDDSVKRMDKWKEADEMLQGIHDANSLFNEALFAVARDYNKIWYKRFYLKIYRAMTSLFNKLKYRII